MVVRDEPCAVCFEPLALATADGASDSCTFWGGRPDLRGKKWQRSCTHAMHWECGLGRFRFYDFCGMCNARVQWLRRGYSERSRSSSKEVRVSELMEHGWQQRHQEADDAATAQALAQEDEAAERADDEAREAEEAVAAIEEVAALQARDAFTAKVEEELGAKTRVWLLACALAGSETITPSAGLPGVMAAVRGLIYRAVPVLKDTYGPTLRSLGMVARKRGSRATPARDEVLLQLLREAGLREVVRFLCIPVQERPKESYWV